MGRWASAKMTISHILHWCFVLVFTRLCVRIRSKKHFFSFLWTFPQNNEMSDDDVYVSIHLYLWETSTYHLDIRPNIVKFTGTSIGTFWFKKLYWRGAQRKSTLIWTMNLFQWRQMGDARCTCCWIVAISRKHHNKDSNKNQKHQKHHNKDSNKDHNKHHKHN